MNTKVRFFTDMHLKNSRIVRCLRAKKRVVVAKKGIFNSKGIGELPMQNGGAVGEKKECCWCAKGLCLHLFVMIN